MLSTAERTVLVAKRFCGPPDFGNGGYTCGLVAQSLTAGAVECTIRKPIPIERELRIDLDGDRARLMDRDELVIEAVGADIDLPVPAPVSFAEAQDAVERSPAYQNHPFPTCFVCGPERREHDGLRVFPGPVQAQEGFDNLFAAPWVPAREFADESGQVRSEFVWAAADCPTGFAAGFPYQGKLVTGRLAVEILGHVRAEDECVLMSWSLGTDGRKCHAGAALFDSNGDACAVAKATWIRVV
jgi:hypothetical protein